MRTSLDDEDLSCEGFVAMTYLFVPFVGPMQFNAGSFPDEIYQQIIQSDSLVNLSRLPPGL